MTWMGIYTRYHKCGKIRSERTILFDWWNNIIVIICIRIWLIALRSTFYVLQLLERKRNLILFIYDLHKNFFIRKYFLKSYIKTNYRHVIFIKYNFLIRVIFLKLWWTILCQVCIFYFSCPIAIKIYLFKRRYKKMSSIRCCRKIIYIYQSKI